MPVQPRSLPGGNPMPDKDETALQQLREAMAERIGTVTTVSKPDEWAHHVAPNEAMSMATVALMARIPQACQTCKGKSLDEYLSPDSCPDCPTIGTLLLYGWNVATAKPTIGWEEQGYINSTQGTAMDPAELLAALREVPT